MFGKKKTNILTSNNLTNEVNEQSNPSNNNQINDDADYIYYNENPDEDYFISQLEIYVKPNNYPDKQILVVVKKDITFEELYSQIQENFKSMQEFKTISNISITNFSKKFAETGIKLPLKGPIEQHLKSGDIILCDIISEEHWLKTFFQFEVKNHRKFLQVEYKIPKRLNFKQIKFILLKAGLSLFYDELNENENLDNTLNYIFVKCSFKKRINRNIKINIEDYKYEVHVSMHFEIFEELIHKQLKTNEIPKTDEHYFRFNEYSNLSFEELMSSGKFIPELDVIKDISKEFLTSQYNNLNSHFCFFNPKNPDTFEGFFNSTEDNTSPDDYDVSVTSDINDFTENTDSSKFASEYTDFSMVGNQRLMSDSSSSTYSKFKPDCNMIIISTFLYFSKSKDNNISMLKSNLSSGLSNFNDTDLDLDSIDSNRNKSMQDDIKIEENPLYSSMLNEAKPNKSQLLPDDLNENENSKISRKASKKNNKKNENIFFIDDESSGSHEKKKQKIKDGRKTYNARSKKYKEIFKNFYKMNDCSVELYDLFNQRKFMKTIDMNYPTIYNKALIEKIKVPESRDKQDVDMNFYNYVHKKEMKKRISYLKYYKLLIILVLISFIYFIIFMTFMNLDTWILIMN